MQNTLSYLFPHIFFMAVIVAASNFLVQLPFDHFGLGEILTWGAFTYPFAFLVTDLANRQFGASKARLVVIFGFAIAVLLSIWLATPRIAIASGSAFLIAQMLDVSVFDRLRNQTWWLPPLLSSIAGSLLDTILFFGLAFAPDFAGIDSWFGMPNGSLGFPAALFGMELQLWQTLAIGDFLVKLLIGAVALLPYGGLLKLTESKAT